MNAKCLHVVFGLGLVVALMAPQRRSWAVSDADQAADALVQSKTTRARWRTLAERIPSVTHRAFNKAGRAELSGQLGLTLSDPFFRSIVPGVAGRYHFDETWAMGAYLAYDGAIRTTIDIVSKANTVLTPDLNHPVFDVGVEGVWSPLYGKISWMAEHVSHFDTYLSAGIGFLALHHGSAVEGTVAVGQHYFISSQMALKIEIREELFSMARDPSASAHAKLQNLLMASLGVTFFVPDVRAFAQP